MRWRALTVLATAGLLVLAGTGPAFAKGADQATITGPGLAQAIVLSGEGEPGTSGDSLGQLANGGGLFLAMFGPSEGQQLAPSAPVGALGPKYEVAFRVPGGAPTPDVVRQDLYPLAAGGPVTYTPPDQTELAGRTTGGWYRAPNGFAAMLAKVGIPGLAVAGTGPASRAATSGAAASRVANQAADQPEAAPAPSWQPASVGVLVAAVLLVAVAIVAIIARRRTRPAS
jgi:hypothetical protein